MRTTCRLDVVLLTVSLSPFCGSEGPSAESAMLISSLRDVIRTQATEMEALQAQLKDLTADSSAQVRPVSCHPDDADAFSTIPTGQGAPRTDR